jgi:uncharacterized membrane protein
MSDTMVSGRDATVRFTGTRGELFGILVRGYFGMLPTLGLFRFWMVTWKRRFYWSHTEIDGDTLEYTGNARQLLLGFLMAVVIFLPIYGILFYVSTQVAAALVYGYAAVGLIFWFLIGYAIYRTRDFRLSRTLWRGIRFDQRGSALGYALRRFCWSLLMVLTVGLVYPFMAGSLWAYRYRNTWFGDRQFTFTGTWKTVAGPYYAIYFVAAAMAAALVTDLVLRHDYTMVKDSAVPNWPVVLGSLLLSAFLCYGVYFYRGREISRMFSSIGIGAASVRVVVRGRAMFGQLMLYGLCIAGALTAFAVIFGILFASMIGPLVGTGGTLQAADLARILQGSFTNFLTLVLGYLALLATFAILGEVMLGFGFWMLVARGAVISGIDDLKTVRAGPEDPSLVGEGIASALNLGSY